MIDGFAFDVSISILVCVNIIPFGLKGGKRMCLGGKMDRDGKISKTTC
jgi:hypothetical protein